MQQDSALAVAEVVVKEEANAIHARHSAPTKRQLLKLDTRSDVSDGTVELRRHRTIWTPQEDDILRRAVKKYNFAHWKKISEEFPDHCPKSEVQCLHRWQKVLDPRLVKGQWTQEEDNLIIELVKEHGEKKWSKIANFLTGRIGKQCRERWINHLNPGVNRAKFTEEEDQHIVEFVREHGHKWAQLARELGTKRSDNQLKNRFNSKLRHLLEVKSRRQRGGQRAKISDVPCDLEEYHPRRRTNCLKRPSATSSREQSPFFARKRRVVARVQNDSSALHLGSATAFDHSPQNAIELVSMHQDGILAAPDWSTGGALGTSTPLAPTSSPDEWLRELVDETNHPDPIAFNCAASPICSSAVSPRLLASIGPIPLNPLTPLSQKKKQMNGRMGPGSASCPTAAIVPPFFADLLSLCASPPPMPFFSPVLARENRFSKTSTALTTTMAIAATKLQISPPSPVLTSISQKENIPPDHPRFDDVTSSLGLSAMIKANDCDDPDSIHKKLLSPVLCTRASSTLKPKVEKGDDDETYKKYLRLS